MEILAKILKYSMNRTTTQLKDGYWAREWKLEYIFILHPNPECF